MQKSHTAYSFLEVPEFVQTRMQNARDERERNARREKALFYRFFREAGGSADAKQGGRFRGPSPMPEQPPKGIDTVLRVKRNSRQKRRLSEECHRPELTAYASRRR
jgi:hypothetical protein